MKLKNIIPTQDYIRNELQIPNMIEFVQAGNYFTQEALDSYDPSSKHSLIRLTQFENGALFLADGHHRAIAILAGGRDELDASEFFIEEWTYSAYQEIVFTYPDGSWMGWVTPHDPLKQLRIPQLFAFKSEVKEIWSKDGEEAAIQFIRNNPGKYCKSRNINTIKELYENYLESCQKLKT